jgi:adenylosuccinate synthase
MTKIDVVVGAQFGSEAKGHVTAQLIRLAMDGGLPGEGEARVVNVRVAGPNAGHTVYDTNGRRYALRQVPVGAAISDDVLLYIAPGSEIDPPVLLEELIQLRDGWHTPQLIVSPEATVIEDLDKGIERGHTLVERVGSTGKGIGAARSRRILRETRRVQDYPALMTTLAEYGVVVSDLDLNDPEWEQVVIEGTQGYGLGLHAGYYPQCTSSDCRAVDFLAMAGVTGYAPHQKVTVYAVARVYPIRVAGNSGPLMHETTWEELGLPEERTTVTQKVRRVGRWDGDLVRRAVAANGGATTVKLIITMLDQEFPDLAGVTDEQQVEAVAGEFLDRLADEAGCPIYGVTTSPTDMAWLGLGAVA